MSKDLHQDLPHPHQGGRRAGGRRAPSQAGDEVANSLPKPKGQMHRRGQAKLFGKEGLPSGGHAGDPETTCQPRVVENLPGQPLQMAGPQEGARNGDDLVGLLLRKWKDLSHVPQLAEDVDLQGIPPLSQEGQPSLPPGMDGPLDPIQAVLLREAGGGGQGGGEGDAEGILGRGTDPVQRPHLPACPASEPQDSSLVRPVEDGR
jgi:hypothetical protein